MTARTAGPMPRQHAGLARLWRSQRDRALSTGRAHDPWCAGHGWMLDAGIVDILEPLVSIDDHGDDSYFRFAALGADSAGQLLRLLPDEYLADERQNDGPTIGNVLRAVVAHPDGLRAHGYVIGAGRCDERITVEGALFRADGDYRLCPLYEPPLSVCDCEALYQRLREEYGVDDALVPPHELNPWFGYDLSTAGETETWYRAWWD